MRLPKTWKNIAPGHYLHLETGVEIRRAGRIWNVVVPAKHTCTPITPAGATRRTLGDAVVLAVDEWLPVMRKQIAAAWDDAHFAQVGRPHEWKPGHAAKKTIAARRAAVTATGTSTGADAKPGQLVVHIATGAPGVFHGLKTFDRPFHAIPAGEMVAAVTFAGDLHLNAPLPYDPADVIVLTHDWLSCNQWSDEPGHEDHGNAVIGECLLPERDQDLAGSPLKWVSRGHWVADDGVELFADRDGTFSAYAPGPHGRTNICCNQPRKTRTYRMINRWRDELPTKIEQAHQAALDIVATRAVIDEAHLELACADVAYIAAVEARLPGNYEAGQVQKIKERLTRAQLKLAHLQGRPFGYTRIVLSEQREGTTWKPLFTSLSEAKACEDPAEHAERYAAMNYFRGHAYRIRIYSDPDAVTPDAEWTNVPDQPCRSGQHTRAGLVMPGARRSDGSLIEAATCGTCLEPLWRVTPFDGQPYPWLLEGEELPPLAPGVIYLSLVQITTRHYGMQINDGLGGWHVLRGVGGFDPESGDVPVTVDNITVPLPGGTMVQLRPTPTAPADPGLDADYPDPTRPPTQTPDLDPTDESINEVRSGLVGVGEIRYRVQAQTRPGDPWRIVQTGVAPTGLQADLDVVAQTVIGNAGPILGLRSDQTFPGLLVQTWRWPTGQTATATELIPDRLERSTPTP